MSNTNRDYYKRVYNKVNASDELKERLMDMRGKRDREGKKKGRMTWKAAVAAAALVVVVPAGVYAATHWGMNDFFSSTGRDLSKEANQLIETEIPQSKQEVANLKIPVEFTVRESLCDSGSVSLVIEAKAKESGKYFLVSEDYQETDYVANLGIKGEETIGEYAKRKGLDILYVGTGFRQDSPFYPGMCNISSKYIQDDILEIGITAKRTEDQKELKAIMLNTVRASGSKEELKEVTTFELKDNSKSKAVLYTSADEMNVAGTSAKVTKVLMEETEVSTYVRVYFTDPKGVEKEGLSFRMKDTETSDEWDLYEGGVETLEDGSYCARLTYNKKQLPEKCVLEAYDCWEKEIFGHIELSKAK